MKKSILFVILSFLLFSCTTKNKSKEGKILVFCASSLTNVVAEIAEEFEAETNINVQLNFASSGTLVRQIEHGANPSLFISANKKWVSYLSEMAKTLPEYDKEVAGNSMVVIVPKTSGLDSLTFSPGLAQYFTGRLSVGDPKHVPAGDYAMQAIVNVGLQEELKDRLLPAKDVRSALLVVELGEAEMGIVYKTDALKSEKVKVVAEISSELHTSIGYFVSVFKKSNNNNTMLFYEFLNSETSKKIWVENGFKFEM